MSERRQKEIARRRVLGGRSSLSPLLLPGEECVDVVRGIELGVFTAKTGGMMVERNPGRFIRMKEQLARVWIGKSPVLHKGELYDSRPCRVDLAFLDYQGNLRSKDVEWMRGVLSPSLTPNAPVYLTFTNRIRGNSFFNVLLREIPEIHPWVVEGAVATRKERVGDNFTLLLVLYQLIFDLVVFPGDEFVYDVMPYCDVDGSDMMLLGVTSRQRRKKRLNRKLIQVGRDIERIMGDT